jgi:hypothetical protein
MLLLLASAIIHVAEETIYDWVLWANQFIEGVTWSQFAFWNTLFLSFCVIGIVSKNIVLQLSLAALVVTNAFIHLMPSLVHWQYSPGLVSALVLYLPAGISAYVIAYQKSLATKKQMLFSIPLGAALMVAPFIYQAFRVFWLQSA